MRCFAPRLPLRRAARGLPALAFLAGVANVAPVCADESGNFVVRLGQDTTSVERYSRTPDRLQVEQIGRTPRVLRRSFTYDFAGGVISRVAMVATPVGSTTPTQTIEVKFDPDSTRVRIQSGTQPAQTLALQVPAGTIVVTNSSPWVGYETQVMKLVHDKVDSLRSPLWFVGAEAANWSTVKKLEHGLVSLATDRGDVYHLRIDEAGRILGVRPIAGPAQYTVDRVAKLDLDAMASEYAAREQAGTGLGVLSPRDTVRVASAGGAGLTIDYSRPAKRGRTIFGGVVPYGEVWRTGANAATQFETDQALDFGAGVIVPAGFYTLWTRPTASGWTLIVNSETGQWGTARKPEKDLVSIPMKVTSLAQPVERFTIAVEPSPQGGVLHFDWDTTRASAAFVVRR